MIAESQLAISAFDVGDRNESEEPLGNVTSLTSAAEPGAADRSLYGRNWEVLALIPVVLAGITGNMLVCIAVRLERKLQTVTNYFLVSLAIADLFVSTLVMPCCIIQEFVGHWPLGFVICDFWQVSDVMLCTSSIMHMCVISIDRYIGIRNPLVARNRSSAVVAFKISFVWILSLFIACPLIFLAIFSPRDLLTSDLQCTIMNNHFLVYGSLSAFFIPLLIMVVAYSLSMRLLSAQARRLSGNAAASGDEPEIRRSCKGSSGTLFTDVARLTDKRCKLDPSSSPPSARSAAAATKVNPMFDASDAFSSNTGSLAETFAHSSSSFCSSSSVSTVSRAPPRENNHRDRQRPKPRDSNPQRSPCYHRRSSSAAARHCAFRRRSGHYLPIDSSETSLTALVDQLEKRDSSQQGHTIDLHLRSQETGLDCLTDRCRETVSGHRGHAKNGTTSDAAVVRWSDRRGAQFSSPSDDEPAQYSVLQHISRVTRSLYNLTASLHRPTPNRRCVNPPTTNSQQTPEAVSTIRFRSLVQKHSATLRVAGILIAKRENRTRAELHSVRTERKAVRVLGAMFAIFVCCWGPFFTVNLAMGISEPFHFDDTLFKALLWLGYLSSTLNPIVYTVFNKNFRKVFVDIILFRRLQCIATEGRVTDA